jgi:hypothetical protein
MVKLELKETIDNVSVEYLIEAPTVEDARAILRECRRTTGEEWRAALLEAADASRRLGASLTGLATASQENGAVTAE